MRARSIDDWADELADEFDALLAAVDRGEDTFLDPYAAEDEAEFFAVATEDFYERPAELEAAHPPLYALLQGILWRRSGALAQCTLTPARRSEREATISSAPPPRNSSRIDRIDVRESPVTAAVIPTRTGPAMADALPIML